MKVECFQEPQFAMMGARAQAPALPRFDARWLELHRPDLHVLAVDGGVVVGRCSCWWSAVPDYPPGPAAMLGHFDAVDETSAQAVLTEACWRARGAGRRFAIGPMDGNTWRRYRWITDPGSEALFMMEPANPPEYPGWWASAGFRPLAEYQSALITKLDGVDERLQRVRDRLAAAGVQIRTLDMPQFEQELRRIYSVSVVAFEHNFLYTALAEPDFLAQYLPYREQIVPAFVFLALHHERCVGFMFSIPDYYRRKSGHPLDTLILKSAAVLPGRLYAGMGNLMAEMTHHAAARAGLKRVIHALALADNPVTNITARYGEIMRRYTLYVKPLGDE